MGYCLITFRSVTPAQRGENVIKRAGFDCSVRRTPRWMEEQGCGYSLRVRPGDAAQCVQLLRNANVPFRKVYLRRENDSVEELSL